MATENQGEKRVNGRTRSADGGHIALQPPHQSTTPLERPVSPSSARSPGLREIWGKHATSRRQPASRLLWPALPTVQQNAHSATRLHDVSTSYAPTNK